MVSVPWTKKSWPDGNRWTWAATMRRKVSWASSCSACGSRVGMLRSSCSSQALRSRPTAATAGSASSCRQCRRDLSFSTRMLRLLTSSLALASSSLRLETRAARISMSGTAVWPRRALCRACSMMRSTRSSIAVSSTWASGYRRVKSDRRTWPSKLGRSPLRMRRCSSARLVPTRRAARETLSRRGMAAWCGSGRTAGAGTSYEQV